MSDDAKTETSEEVSEQQKMVPIAIAEFLNGMVSPADLYIRLGSAKDILVFKSGAKFEQERLNKFLDKNITHLFVSYEDLKKICDSAVSFAEAGISQRFLDMTKKAFLLQNATSSVYRSFENLGIELETFGAATKTADAVLEMVNSDYDILSMFEILHSADHHLAGHAVAASILAPVIGYEMGFQRPATMKLLALGGFMHDIGKSQVPPEILDKPLARMNSAELKEYQQHCLRGAEMLKSLKLKSDDLMAIVFQHHERNDGSGYPQRLRGQKIHPLAKIVGLASEFLNMVMPNPRFNKKPYSHDEALSMISHGFGQPFEKDVYEALCRVVGKKENKKAS